MSHKITVIIITANDCKIADNLANDLQKNLQISFAQNNINNVNNINRKFYKDLKKINQIDQNYNIFYVFIVSSYQNGKKCRSIRRFQRKLDNFKNELNKLIFSIISLDDAKIESDKLLNTLKNKRKCIYLNDNDNIPMSIIKYINSNNCIIPRINDDDIEEIKEKEVINNNNDNTDNMIYDFTISYGTQTGNALQIANEIISIAISKNNKYLINGPISLNELNLNILNKYLIIIVSTTGDGEIPQNGDIFYRKLKMKCLSIENKNNLYKNINYAILGLGDSNYSKFNFAAKNIDKCLSYLGGNKFYHTGYADDGIGLEDVVEPWKYGIINEIQRKLKYKDESIPEILSIPTPSIPSIPSIPTTTTNSYYIPTFSTKFRILKCFNSNILSSKTRKELFSRSTTKETTSYKAYDHNNQFLIELISAKYETSFNNNYYETIIINLTFRLPNGYSYNIGDVLCIYPPNPCWIINKLLNRLNLNGNDIIKINTINEISSTNPLQHIPFKKEITIYDIFRFCIDIRTIPKSKLFIKLLSTFCKNDNDKLKLLNLSNSTNIGEKINKKYKTLFKLLQEYPSCYPSLQCLLHFLLPLKPRKYSICSSPNYKPDEIDICFRVLKYKNNIKENEFDGLCSCFLYSLIIKNAKLLSSNNNIIKLINYKYGFYINNDKISIAGYLKLSPHFKPPNNSLSPLILIGPGTGVAIFRAFLQHRLSFNDTSSICDGPWRGIDMQFGDDINNDNTINGKCLLFYGCRHPKKDYLFKDEWQTFINNGVLNNLFVAFSRYYDNKVYVQHLLKEKSSLISSMILNDNASIFVCGDASKMAKDVENTIIEVIALHSKMSISESQKYIFNMKQQLRYNIDVWST